MTIAFPSNATAGWGTTVTSSVVAKPTGLAAGDLMVGQVTTIDSTDSDTINTPSGWTKIGSEVRNNTSGATQLHQAIFYKIASSGDAAASNFTFTYSSSTFGNAAIIRVTSTIAHASPIDASNSGIVNDSASFAAAGVTPTYADEGYIIFGSNLNGDGTASSYAVVTSNPTWTEQYQDTNSGNKGIFAATATRSVATATGNFSFSTVGASSDSIGHIVAVKEGVSVTVTPDPLTLTLTTPDPTISGGSTVTVDPVTLTLSVPTPDAGQADWSSVSKSQSGTWTAQNKT